jgi:GDPmannose 4,6-dehydratase
VEKKIVDGLVDIKLGKSEVLKLGNLNSSRDIGHAKEYVEGMWRMLQQESPIDFVLATGVSYTIREIVEMTSIKLGMNIKFIGEGEEEIGVIIEDGRKIVEVDPKYFRPSEVDLLIGDATEAKKVLGWEPKLSLSHIIDEMIEDKINSYGL